MSRKRSCLLLAAVALGCGGEPSPTTPLATPSPTASSVARIPLTDMGGASYLGFAGGLYPGRNNAPPTDHLTAGLARAALVEPLDAQGRGSSRGSYVLLSIGMSNTTQEFCSAEERGACAAWSFAGQAAADPEVDHARLAIVNGAAGGRSASFWDSPDDPDYDRVRDTQLSSRGLSERQVQIVWVKVANPRPTTPLPSPQADAHALLVQTGGIARALKRRYPNVRLVFLSSRTYAGYATTDLNPEPYAYESGFAVKWLVEAQIQQMRTGAVDSRAGNLDYEALAPWLAWGPYLWADGLNPRSDGLFWERADFENDGTHPSRSGETKVGALLLQFFKTSPLTRCWFVAGESC